VSANAWWQNPDIRVPLEDVAERVPVHNEWRFYVPSGVVRGEDIVLEDVAFLVEPER